MAIFYPLMSYFLQLGSKCYEHKQQYSITKYLYYLSAANQYHWSIFRVGDVEHAGMTRFLPFDCRPNQFEQLIVVLLLV